MATISLHNVAKRAGVSIKTLSRVINNVRENTRVVRQKAVQSLNYRPNASARSLKGRRSYLLGLLYTNPTGSYVANVRRGVNEKIRESIWREKAEKNCERLTLITDQASPCSKTPLPLTRIRHVSTPAPV